MPQKNKIKTGTNKDVKTKYLPLKFENKINGKTDIDKTTRLAEKLPINENICIKFSLDDNTIEGISQGNPVNILALKYSKSDKKIIIFITEIVLSLVSNLAITQAHPQNNAKTRQKYYGYWYHKDMVFTSYNKSRTNPVQPK